jgi:hypothetical protein
MAPWVYRPDAWPAKAAAQFTCNTVTERTDLMCWLNHKTVAKWRKRAFVNDVPMGPKAPHSTVLSPGEEAIVVAFRKHTLLPLDDCLYALQATIPNLTRSSLHRCLKRHGISRLPEIAAVIFALRLWRIDHLSLACPSRQTNDFSAHTYQLPSDAGRLPRSICE